MRCRRLIPPLLSLLVLTVLGQQQTTLPDVRKLFFESGQGDCKAKTLYQLLNRQSGPQPPALEAYRGATRAMMARCTANPHRKLAYFNEGKAALDKAVKLAPNNLDVRYARYMVQLNAPKFLGYNNRKEDIEAILFLLESSAKRVDEKGFRNDVIRSLFTDKELVPSHKNRLELLLLKTNS